VIWTNPGEQTCSGSLDCAVACARGGRGEGIAEERRHRATSPENAEVHPFAPKKNHLRHKRMGTRPYRPIVILAAVVRPGDCCPRRRRRVAQPSRLFYPSQQSWVPHPFAEAGIWFSASGKGWENKISSSLNGLAHVVVFIGSMQGTREDSACHLSPTLLFRRKTTFVTKGWGTLSYFRKCTGRAEPPAIHEPIQSTSAWHAVSKRLRDSNLLKG
jgi:hypothetical protein